VVSSGCSSATTRRRRPVQRLAAVEAQSEKNPPELKAREEITVPFTVPRTQYSLDGEPSKGKDAFGRRLVTGRPVTTAAAGWILRT
jgi:hypothetical protein